MFIPRTSGIHDSKRARKYRRMTLFWGVLLLLMIFSAIRSLLFPSFTPNAFAASGPKPILKKASFTLDGVKLHVATPFLPGNFSSSNPGDATQEAVATTAGIAGQENLPFGAIYITAVPYNTQPKTEGVPIAQAGGAQTYRDTLYQYRVNEGDNPQSGPSITIFGQQVVGEASLMQGDVKVAYSSTVVVEWVAEAGRRLWIVRITNEEPLGTTNLTPATSFLRSLNFLTISSSNISHATTVKTALASATVTPAVLSSYPTPSWWSSTCHDSNGASPSGSYAIASWHNIAACGPVDTANTSYFGGKVTIGVSEWQCVELVQRYFILAGYLKNDYIANGNQIVSKYPASNLIKITNNTKGLYPKAGDVLSYNTNASTGHTSLVISSSVNSSGNGTIEVLEQNTSYYNSAGTLIEYATETYTVSSWNVEVTTWPATVLGWLHDPGTVTPPTPTPTPVPTNTPTPTPTPTNPGGVNHQDTFAVGTNGHLFDYYWHQGNVWVINDLGAPASGVTLTGTPTADTFTSGGSNFQHVLALGSNGHLYEYWQFLGQSWSINDLNAAAAPPSGVTFVGSPGGFSYTDSGITYHSIFILGSDNHLYNYAWSSSNTSVWTLTDLTNTVSLPTGVTPTGTPAEEFFVINGTSYQDVMFVGNDGNIYEYWQFIGNSWALNNLGAPSGETLTGSLSIFSYADSDGTAHHSVFALTTDNQLYDDDWTWTGTGGSWLFTDLTSQFSLPSGVTPTGSPNGNLFVVAGIQYQHVEIVGSDGALYEFWQTTGNSGENWNGFNDLTQLTSSSAVVTGSPWGQSYSLEGSTLESHSVYVITSDGHLQEFNWVEGSGNGTWIVIDHGIPSGTSLLGNSPVATAYNN